MAKNGIQLAHNKVIQRILYEDDQKITAKSAELKNHQLKKLICTYDTKVSKSKLT
jgi:hypothetical protein